MADRLPPLHALRIFEVAARNLSYSRAAGELCVTHAAVSQQIRILEQYLGTRLFRRSDRAMLLTQSGEVLYRHVREGLQSLRQGVDEVRARRGTLTLGVLPGFAARWLVPRLPDFHRAHPDIGVNLRASMALTDFSREEIDVAIRFGAGHWAGLEAEKLLDEQLLPVCSPHYRGGELPRTPGELSQCTLLHDAHEPWDQWFLSVGLPPPAIRQGPGFSESNLLLRAAADGQGVALAPGALVQEELSTGELVQCLPGLQARYAYYVVHPEMAAPVGLHALKSWLKAQAGPASPGRHAVPHAGR